jgi:hypothetical protein
VSSTERVSSNHNAPCRFFLSNGYRALYSVVKRLHLVPR